MRIFVYVILFVLACLGAASIVDLLNVYDIPKIKVELQRESQPSRRILEVESVSEHSVAVEIESNVLHADNVLASLREQKPTEKRFLTNIPFAVGTVVSVSSNNLRRDIRRYEDFIMHGCTATLVAPRYALSAAHCFGVNKTGDDAVTLPGANTSVFFNTIGLVPAEKIHIPPNYVAACDSRNPEIECEAANLKTTFAPGNGDIALIELQQPVFEINPAAINYDADINLYGKQAVFYGASGAGIGELRSPTANSNSGIISYGVVRINDCRGLPQTQHLICWIADEEGEFGSHVATCGGDSGGPIFADTGLGLKIVGITHFGTAGDAGCFGEYERELQVWSMRLSDRAEWLSSHLKLDKPVILEQRKLNVIGYGSAIMREFDDMPTPDSFEEYSDLVVSLNEEFDAVRIIIRAQNFLSTTTTEGTVTLNENMMGVYFRFDPHFLAEGSNEVVRLRRSCWDPKLLGGIIDCTFTDLGRGKLLLPANIQSRASTIINVPETGRYYQWTAIAN